MSVAITRPRRRNHGFSLIDVMVGLTVGLLAVLAITQTLSVFENQKRTTTANADAQENGLLGMYAIEQDARKAAAGFTHPQAFSCQNFHSYFSDTAAVPPVPAGTIGSFDTTPVSIIDGGAGNPDQIVVRTGSRFLGSIPTKLDGSAMDPVARTLEVERVYDFTDQDLVMVVSTDGTNCTLMRVTAVDAANHKLTYATGQSPEYNPDDAYMTTNNWPCFGTTACYQENALVFRVGTTGGGGVTSRTYSINANNGLQALNAVTGAVPSTEILSSEIVDLQAQCGIAPVGSQQITEWKDATVANGWAAPSVTDRQRIKAIRVVVVARSGKRDGALVTNTCPQNHAGGSGNVNYGPCPWRDSTADPAPIVDLRAAPGDTEWQHYRYKAYQTIIPLRNVMWSNV